MTGMQTRRLLLCSVAIASLLVYWPGVNGDFLLDDYGSLPALGDFNGVRNAETFLRFMRSGIAGPTGRPISLLSFLLNAHNWPADPLPFKITNIVLHAGCGMFLYALLYNLAYAYRRDAAYAAQTALIAAALWALHPFFVSTVLYVVQRMAMLAAFFSIAALWLYSQGRMMLASRPRRAYVCMTAAVVIGTLLATFSKENGALLPLLILVVEYCIYRHPDTQAEKLNAVWFGVFLLLPSALLLAYLVSMIDPAHWQTPFPGRDFSLSERLLTESRIVSGYLYHLYIPRMFYPGVFNENFPLSRDLTQPASTLPAVLSMLILPLLAWYSRHRWPFLTLALVFFIAGHLMESTVIPLELYFEHRNYLPAIFLFAPVGALFALTGRRLIKAAVVLLVALCVSYTYQYSKLWGNSIDLAVFWAQQNPHSVRAQRTAALLLEQKHDVPAAFRVLEQASMNNPGSFDLSVHWMLLKCHYGFVTQGDFDAVKAAAARFVYNSHYYNLLETVAMATSSAECKGMGGKKTLELLDLLINKSQASGFHSDVYQLHHLKGIVYAGDNQPDPAFREFTLALDITKNIDHGLLQTAILASNGFLQQAKKHIENTERLLPESTRTALPNFEPDYAQEVVRIKEQIEQDIKRVDAVQVHK